LQTAQSATQQQNKPEGERLYPHLQLVPMPLGKVSYESGDLLRHVYFPTDSIISLLYVMADGASAEISVVGNEGLIGIALFMGGETTPSRAVVQSAGSAYRLMGQYVSLAAAVSRSPVLQHVDHDPGAHRQHAGRAP
jgi:hypothetical protein